VGDGAADLSGADDCCRRHPSTPLADPALTVMFRAVL